MITITHYLKVEWSRFAVAAYGRRHLAIGHRFSAAASLPTGSRMPVQQFDSLMREYRAWLCFGEYRAPAPAHRREDRVAFAHTYFSGR